MKVQYQELQVKDYIIRGLLTTPDTPYQTICVMLHGYTGNKNENGFLFKQITELFIKHNIATLRFDYMGSGDSDKEFKDQSFNTVLDDARAIINYALKLNEGKKIVLLGFSMGGAASAQMSVEYFDKLERLILISPAGNMPLICKSNYYSVMKENDVVDLGGYYIGKCYYDSLVDYDMYKGVGNYEGQVLIIQGGSDITVLPEYSKKYDTLYKNSKYVLVEGAPHCYTKVEYRKELLQAIDEFLSK